MKYLEPVTTMAPVNAILSRPGCSDTIFPAWSEQINLDSLKSHMTVLTTLSSPGRILVGPLGNPTSIANSPTWVRTSPSTVVHYDLCTRNADRGVWGAVFITVVQPTAKDGPSFHACISRGKFQGIIYATIISQYLSRQTGNWFDTWPTTPTGSYSKVPYIPMCSKYDLADNGPIV